MSLWKRLKNLWALSELEVPSLGEKTYENPTGTVIVPWLKKSQMATIVPDPGFLEKLEL